MHMSDRGHRGCVKKYNHKADELKLGNRQSPVGCRNSIIFYFIIGRRLLPLLVACKWNSTGYASGLLLFDH